MSEMLSWLRSVIEYDKALAQVAGYSVRYGVRYTGHWTYTLGDDLVYQDGSRVPGGSGIVGRSCSCCGPAALGHPHDLMHVATHDPRDTIARCTAELALLDLHKIVSVTGWGYREWAPKAKPYGCELCHENNGLIMGAGYCDTLTLLASARRHREGFKPEWVSG